MDRQIVYRGAIPKETDILNTNRYAMTALGKLSSALLGNGTQVVGLACAPTNPPSLAVLVGPGEIYSLANIDDTDFGSLPADAAHQILKQGMLMDALTLPCPAPTAPGTGINYLVQAGYQEIDSGAVVLPYYNTNNPAQSLAGPGDSGAPQNTVRAGVCSVTVKAGVPAAAGTQQTPAPDSGYVGLWVVSVSSGHTAVAQAAIAKAEDAPFVRFGGARIEVESTAPDAPAKGDGWLNDATHTLAVWDGAQWVVPVGQPGPPGAQGPQGAALALLGSLAGSGDLPPTANAGDAYLIDGDLWAYNGTYWADIGPIISTPATPQPEAGTLMMRDADGRAQVQPPQADLDIATAAFVASAVAGAIGAYVPPVVSVNGHTGAVTLSAQDVALPTQVMTASTTAAPGVMYLCPDPGYLLTWPASLVKGQQFGYCNVSAGTAQIDCTGVKVRGQAVDGARIDVAPKQGHVFVFVDSTIGMY